MKNLKKRQGSAYILVIMVLVVTSIFAALSAKMLDQSILNMHTYSLQMQAYYLNREAEETAVAALLTDDQDLLDRLSFPASTAMTHYSGSEDIGESEISYKIEKHPYYGTESDWIVIHVTTSVPDVRSGFAGKTFTYEGTVLVLKDNPMIQLFNRSPDSL